MRRSSFILVACMTAGAVVATRAGDVRAGSCTTVANIYTYDHAPPLEQTNWSDPLVTIPKFNPADGTLCMVVVRQNATLQASLHATNTSPSSPATLTAAITDTVVITPPSGPIASVTHAFSFGPTPVTVAAGGSTTFGFGPLPFNNEQTFANPGDLAQFTGAGQNLVFPSVTANGTFSISTTSGNANVVGTVNAGAHIEILYYVPEPASIALLAAGLLLITRRPRRTR